MNSGSYATGLSAVLLVIGGGMADARAQEPDPQIELESKVKSVLERIVEPSDLRLPGGRRVIRDRAGDSDSLRYSQLTELDFQVVADELGVELAAIKAVVSIEAGNRMKGFWAPGIPVANFANSLFLRYKQKVKSPGAKGESVPEGLTGSARLEWTQLINARKINAQAANMSVYWGMFQIGGFNYSLCGCKDVDEFVKLVSYSELEQLELFAAFVSNAGMLDDLRNRNWTAFARKYNGPGFAKRGYHTRMAAAYKKFKAEEEDDKLKLFEKDSVGMEIPFAVGFRLP